MPYLDCNTRPIKVLVKKEFLYDEQDHHGEFQLATMVSVKSIPGQALLFQVLLDNGVLRDKLPIHALLAANCATDEINHLPLSYLQIWNCFSYQITAQEIDYLSGLRVDVFLKDRTWKRGTLLWTFNWSGESLHGYDLSLSEEPDEHKSGHFIEFDDGQFAIQPNNRVRFYESSFVTKPFPERPDYKVCTKTYECEQADKWVTEDTDRYMYDVLERDTEVKEKKQDVNAHLNNLMNKYNGNK